MLRQWLKAVHWHMKELVLLRHDGEGLPRYNRKGSIYELTEWIFWYALLIALVFEWSLQHNLHTWLSPREVTTDYGMILKGIAPGLAVFAWLRLLYGNFYGLLALLVVGGVKLVLLPLVLFTGASELLFKVSLCWMLIGMGVGCVRSLPYVQHWRESGWMDIENIREARRAKIRTPEDVKKENEKASQKSNDQW